MPETREFDLSHVLNLTHHMPIQMDPYLELLSFLNQRPAHLFDVVEPAVAWILEQHPYLADIPRPQGVSDSETDEQTERDALIWAAWATGLKAGLGATVALTPIPYERRDHRSMAELVLEEVDNPAKILLIDPTRPDLGLSKPDDDPR